MPTAHYIPLSALADNGLHPSNPNRTTETAPRLDVNVPRSNPHLASNNIIGNDPRTMDVTTNGLSLLVSQPNSDSTVNNDQLDKKNYTRFNGRFEDLKAYKEKYGHVNVSRKTDKSLFNWCANIRSARRNPETCKRKLTQKRIAALDAIGFDWRSETSSRTRNKTISFQDRVKAMSEYKEINGHLNVTFKANKSLNDWCQNMRNARSKPGEGTMKLTQERIASLDAIGFDWNPIRGQRGNNFQDRVVALREYKVKNGHINVTQKDDKSLFTWCTNIRSARRGKLGMKLTTDGIAALDAIGFDWNPIGGQGGNNFQDRVVALREYKEKNGHLSVSKKDDKSLYNWCQNIRNARSKSGEGTMKLTANRIAALDAIGFDWRLSKSVLQPSDSLGDDADNAPDKSEENNNTVLDCQYVGDGFHHDDLEHVGISNTSVTFQEISIDSLTAEEKIMFDAIERSISAAEE